MSPAVGSVSPPPASPSSAPRPPANGADPALAMGPPQQGGYKGNYCQPRYPGYARPPMRAPYGPPGWPGPPGAAAGPQGAPVYPGARPAPNYAFRPQPNASNQPHSSQSKVSFANSSYPPSGPMYNGPSSSGAAGASGYPSPGGLALAPSNNNNNNGNNSYGVISASSSGLPCGSSSATNGPDGLHDESSQQSTLSQSSDRSDGRQTPKATSSTGSSSGYASGGNGAMMMPVGGYAPSSPHGSASPSHDCYGTQRELTSPSWQHQRSPISQMYHGGQPAFGSISGDPRRIPSPSLADSARSIPRGGKDSLGRLYEMDGHPERPAFLDKLLAFMEQRGSPILQCPTISKNPLDLFKLYIFTKERGGYMECTKNKTWKDIAAQLGIGASSSGAYTLKKHYGKHLLPFECHFDRGGIDPAPLLAHVEAQTKKKPKPSNSVHPPPAPSPGSQDSRDSLSNYSGSNQNSQDSYSSFSYNATPIQTSQQLQPTGYPSYGPGVMPSGPPKESFDSYGNRAWGMQGSMVGFSRPHNGRASPSESALARMPWAGPSQGATLSATDSVPRTTTAYPTTATPPQAQQSSYAGLQSYSGQQAYPAGGMPVSTIGSSTPMKPGSINSQAASASYTAYNNRPGGPQWQQMRYPGPPGYGGQLPPGAWRGPTNVVNGPRPSSAGPWMDQQRQQYYGPQWGPSMMRPGMRPQYRPELRGHMGSRPGFGLRGMRPESIVFPAGSVEATQPLLVKRKRHTKLDVQPVEGWRLVMALKSGLLMESAWAIDILNILLFDDNAVSYFGLNNMPGLLDLLLEHFQAALKSVFGIEEQRDVSDCESDRLVPKSMKRVINYPNEDDKSERLFNVSVSRKRPRFGDVVKDIEERFVSDDRKCLEIITSTEDMQCEPASSELLHHGVCADLQHLVPEFVSEPGITSRQKSVDGASEIKLEGKNEEDQIFCPEDSSTETEEEDIVLRVKRLTGIEFCDPEAARRRYRRCKDRALLEDECHMSDEASLNLVTESQDQRGRRAVALSTVLRNLSFVPGNESELCRNANLIRLLGQMLLHQHWHPRRLWGSTNNYERKEDREQDIDQECLSLRESNEWWWDHLHPIRENVLVILANVSGSLDLSLFDEELALPILDGLLEWSVSSSSYAQDPCIHNQSVSPQRLALEAMCKLALNDHNAGLLLTTPPFSRVQSLMNLLVKKLYRFEDQVVRELSINLLFYLSGGDSGISRVIATTDQSGVSLLLCFIEQAEHNAMLVAQQHGVNALRDNPDSMGTSLDMLRKAAATLEHLSRHPDNCSLFLQHEQRVLTLVMSQILDQGVAAILANVLFNLGREQQQDSH